MYHETHVLNKCIMKYMYCIMNTYNYCDHDGMKITSYNYNRENFITNIKLLPNILSFTMFYQKQVSVDLDQPQ